MCGCDSSSKMAVIIDPVLDYGLATRVISTHTAESLSIFREKGYEIDRILETHVHADHLTAAPSICTGRRIREAQSRLGQIYDIPPQDYDDIFDNLFDDNKTFVIGALAVTIMNLPDQTPHYVRYKKGSDSVFCGDSLADSVFDSGSKLLALLDDTKFWTGHDYPPVKDHRKYNKHLYKDVNKVGFVLMRQERGAKLAEPKLLVPSLQINLRAGRFPKQTESGHSFLHLSLKFNMETWQDSQRLLEA
ncbi:putative metallo-beta-lactamase domain protein [Calycina marina]|uniref:Metallo-beta-lactamase domain protein n=1 Tax=Calycina marina TaxID=1763456 RepID=A0A9P8CBP3_9HELO|nr:putative metallo-beta-lactamase domain protein [Calycina marina]